ncbi:MAG: DUF4230 domain-containing protein [Mogibacterium sp.]|nr:DUF4230 domain-containing protein [Mogibacterium sp.]
MKKIFGIVLIICGLGIGFFGIPTVTGGDAFSKVKNGNEGAVTEKLSYIAELSVLDFKYSNATSIEDSYKIKQLQEEIKIPFTEKKVVMTYDGDIKLGVDADKITVDITKGAGGSVKEVTVGLPPIKITTNDIDRNSINYPLEKNNILNDIDTEDLAKMEEDGKAEMAEAVQTNGAMDRAKEELKSTITGYLTAMYGDEVKITFTDIE